MTLVRTGYSSMDTLKGCRVVARDDLLVMLPWWIDPPDLVGVIRADDFRGWYYYLSGDCPCWVAFEALEAPF